MTPFERDGPAPMLRIYSGPKPTPGVPFVPPEPLVEFRLREPFQVGQYDNRVESQDFGYGMREGVPTYFLVFARDGHLVMWGDANPADGIGCNLNTPLVLPGMRVSFMPWEAGVVVSAIGH